MFLRHVCPPEHPHAASLSATEVCSPVGDSETKNKNEGPMALGPFIRALRVLVDALTGALDGPCRGPDRALVPPRRPLEGPSRTPCTGGPCTGTRACVRPRPPEAAKEDTNNLDAQIVSDAKL